MKKFISIALGMVLALSMVACSSNGDSASDTSKNSVSYEGTYEELLEMAETVELNNDTFEQYFEIDNYVPKDVFGDDEDDIYFYLKSRLYDDGYIILNTEDELQDIAVEINDRTYGWDLEKVTKLGDCLNFIGYSYSLDGDIPFTFSRVEPSQLKILSLDYVKSYEQDDNVDKYINIDYISGYSIEFINGYKMIRQCSSNSKY